MPADIPECWVGWGTAQHQQTSPYTELAGRLWPRDLAMLVTAWLCVMPEDSRSNLPIPRAVTLLLLHFPPRRAPTDTSHSLVAPCSDLTAGSGLQWRGITSTRWGKKAWDFPASSRTENGNVSNHMPSSSAKQREHSPAAPCSPSPGRRSQLGNAAAPEDLDRRGAACRSQNPQKTLHLQPSQEAGPQESCTKNSAELTHCMRSPATSTSLWHAGNPA